MNLKHIVGVAAVAGAAGIGAIVLGSGAERLNDEQRMIGQTAEEFIDKEVIPALDRLEQKDWALARNRQSQAGHGIIPSDQCLGPSQLAAYNAYLGLVVKHEFFSFQRSSQAIFDA